MPDTPSSASSPAPRPDSPPTLFHTTVYGVTILGIIDIVRRHTGRDDIAAFANLRQRSPLLATYLAIFLVSLYYYLNVLKTALVDTDDSEEAPTGAIPIPRSTKSSSPSWRPSPSASRSSRMRCWMRSGERCEPPWQAVKEWIADAPLWHAACKILLRILFSSFAAKMRRERSR